MEAKDCVLREYSVRLRRCDHAHSRAPEWHSATAPELAAPTVPVYTGVPEVLVKTEYEPEDITPQDGQTGLTYPFDCSETVVSSLVKPAYEFIVKTEDEADEVRVKQELDVGPTVLTPQNARRARIVSEEGLDISGTSKAAPALPDKLAQPGPSTKTVDDCCKTDSRTLSDAVVVFGTKGSDYSTREGHLCRCIKPQIECACKTDGSTAKIAICISERQYHYEDCNYSTTNKPYFRHVQIHVNEQTSDSEKNGHSSSGLDLSGRDIRCQRDVEPQKPKRREYRASKLGGLGKHMPTYATDKPYKCELCEYSASRLGTLKQHRLVHTGEKPYKCEYCDYSASRLRDLTIHMRNHTGYKPYKCEQCEYSASRLGTLKQHQLVHTGEKPYKCEQCEYSASQISNLTMHMRIHTGDKPYKCEQCEYSAAQLSNVMRHMRTHTIDKPYKCHLCEYSALYPRTLKRHWRIHMGETRPM